MTKQKGICMECGIEYEYEYNPRFPRKYCPACSAKKKQAYEDNQAVPVEKPGQPIHIPSSPEYAKSVGDMRKSVKGSAYEKDPVGLAVEIFSSIWKSYKEDPDAKIMPNAELLMTSSIKLVKQAQEAFS